MLYLLGGVPTQYFGLDPIDPLSSYSSNLLYSCIPVVWVGAKRICVNHMIAAKNESMLQLYNLVDRSSADIS